MDSFMDWFWLMTWWFFFVIYLMLLFQIITDLFRDRDLNGWAKALWVIGLIVLPYLVAFIYIVARGRAMAERRLDAMRASQQATEAYIRTTAGSGASSAEEIATAKALLDSGTIDAREFAQLKAKALA